MCRFSECLDDYIAQDNTVRVVDAFIGELDMVALRFKGATPAATGRPSYHPAVMLRVYLYGIPKPHCVESPSRARVPAQCGADVVDRQAGSGFQNNC